MTTGAALALNDGRLIPQIGFGVFQIEPDQTVECVRTALDVGYRHIDTAQLYGNESEVGTAIADSDVDREDVFITTKLHKDRHGRDTTRTAFDASRRRLRSDYVDLFLIHLPVPPMDEYLTTWRALEELRSEGKVRSIGVSNLDGTQLHRVIAETGIVPSVNQVELHPWLTQDALRSFHARHDIVTEAWRPIAKGSILDHPLLESLATKHERTPAQVVLRWHLQLGIVSLPKSVTPERIRENIEIFDFELSPVDLAAISALDDDPRKPPSRTSESLDPMPTWSA